MHIPSSTCPVCGKPKSGNMRKKVNHDKCSKALQEKFQAVNRIRGERSANRG